MATKSELQNLSAALADAVQTGGAAVVTVDARPRFPASGVLTAPGIVLTASHAVQEDDIKVRLPDGEEHSAELLGRDPNSDLALLKVATKGTPAQTNEEPQVGQLALALGRPTSEGVQASLGIVSAIGGPFRSHQGGFLEGYLRSDAIPYPGFSGGPLVDAEGRVLGINTSGIGMGAALTIPARLAWKIAAAIQEHGGVKRGFLGVRSQRVDLNDENRAALKREQTGGLLVMGVEKNSPAAAGGLIVGDVIVGLAGQPVAEHDELLMQLNDNVVGKPVDVEVLRGGRPLTVKVTIGESPEADEAGFEHHMHRRMRRGGWMWRQR